LALFQDVRLELHMSEAAWSETRHELRRRVGVMGTRQGLLEEEQEALYAVALGTLETCLHIIPVEAYTPYEEAARARVPADPNDWPSAALALALDTGVWTEDRDFFGSGLATWRTPVLQHHVQHYLTETP
jgi:predicted nucleic acid-binding protein